MSQAAFTYRTIDKSGESVHRVLASKHLGFARFVRNEDEIKQLLDQWWQEHHNAHHICYAWRLGWDKNRYRINDDGEPSGTAGKPIYGQILAADLTNVLVAVVRYFGGTKLGTGGLIDAYKTAAQMAIADAVVVERNAMQVVHLSFPYEHMPTVMKMLKMWEMEKWDAQYEATCSMRIGLNGAVMGHFEKWAAEHAFVEFKKGEWI